MEISELLAAIKGRKAVIAVVGLGRVGLPLAALLADAGYRVLGLDVDEARVDAANAGRNPWQEPGLDAVLERMTNACRFTAWVTPDKSCYVLPNALSQADVVIVCVPTPIDIFNRPDHTALLAALAEVAAHCHHGVLVIVESTLAPGTMRDVVAPALAGISPYLAHCPERVSPGQVLYSIRHNPRIIGGTTQGATDLAMALYDSFVVGKLHSTNAATAEITKCAENAYRDVQIAFANELSCLCEHLDVDFWRVRDLVNTCPGRMVHLAGPGVGGSCLPKDTHLLVSDQPYGEWLYKARQVNDYMRVHALQMLMDALHEAAPHMDYDEVKIAVLGIAYRAEVPDTVNSPGLWLVRAIRETGATVAEHDPLALPGVPLIDVVRDADAVLFVVPHSEYARLDWFKIGTVMRRQVLVDCTGTIWPVEGFVFRGIGRVKDAFS